MYSLSSRIVRIIKKNSVLPTHKFFFFKNERIFFSPEDKYVFFVSLDFLDEDIKFILVSFLSGCMGCRRLNAEPCTFGLHMHCCCGAPLYCRIFPGILARWQHLSSF